MAAALAGVCRTGGVRQKQMIKTYIYVVFKLKADLHNPDPRPCDNLGCNRSKLNELY